ncbi:MAG: hypothetical protein Q7R82_02845, partial [Candidatus Daviesbacteria bacterium]|nr:hypothetical protein [Candidatus Daviesbacteria bacterium]
MSERRPDLRIDIIAPSAYDDRGDLKQYWMVLMRPPVFAVLDGLADQAANDFGLNISIAHHNERTKRGEDYLGSIIRARSLADENVVLITAKSFEVPRAIDIAKKLKEAGMQVVLGGPGITLADCRVYDYLVQEGIPFNVGEGENTVSQIIQDAVDHQLRPAYWQKGYVDMRQAPLPALPRKSEYRQMIQGFAAIDIGQGCPFKCSYCSARELRGRRMTVDRSRDVSSSMPWIREAHDRGFSVMIIDD